MASYCYPVHGAWPSILSQYFIRLIARYSHLDSRELGNSAIQLWIIHIVQANTFQNSCNASFDRNIGHIILAILNDFNLLYTIYIFILLTTV